MFKTLIIINLALIIISLISGAFFLAKEKGNSNRIVTSLTIRVGLSICLICLLLIGYFTGNLKPHGI
ncbi:MAG: twin transmembrane helix small protein [Gammaproteobacteria bacterium]|nr:twin transmembrane helix small protein [Gammaproteobacteria bacterium]